jgi:ATP-dependent helicase/nuclease subunit A
LPAVEQGQRRSAAARWLAAAGGVGDEADRAAIVETVMAVLDDPAHAALFGPDSLGEAPISAVLGNGQVIAGTIDRLWIGADRVRVVDFKTGRRVPAALADVPTFHLRQMAAYAEALRVIFPGRAVEAALLYTAGPKLIELPPDLLARHKPVFVPEEQS